MILDQLLVVMIPRIAAGPHLDLETSIKIKSVNQSEQVNQAIRDVRVLPTG